MANFVRGATRIYEPAPPPSTQPVVQSRTDVVTLDKDRSKPPEKGDSYLSALLKLIPAEIITIYLATKEAAAAHDNGLTILFLACLVTCIIFRIFSNLPDKPGAKIRADVQGWSVIVSAIAFVLWAFATAEQGKPPVAIAGWTLEPWLAGILAGLFGIVAPLVVPADPQTK